MPFPRHLILTFLAFAIPAAHGGDTLTLAEALALTLRKSPELSAYNWETRAAEARVIQSRLRPNPELGLTVENPTGSGRFSSADEMETTLEFSQLVELGGKREARIAEARAGQALTGWDYEIKRIEVLKETTLAFIDVLAAQETIRLAQDTAALAEAVTPLAEKRVEVGKASAVEATRSRIAVASAKIQLEQARRTLDTARGNLAAQWGDRRADFSAVSGDLDRLKGIPSAAELTVRVMRNPQLARWAAEREKREAAIASARAQRRPDATLMVGPRMFGKGDDVTVVAGVSLPLPFFNRNQGAIAEAQAQAAKADDERLAAEAKVFAALNEACQTLARASREAEILQLEVLPGAEQAERSIIDGYEAGRFTQLEILDARRTLIEARNQRLRALADYHKARAEIDALTAGASETTAAASRPAFRTAPAPKK